MSSRNSTSTTTECIPYPVDSSLFLIPVIIILITAESFGTNLEYEYNFEQHASHSLKIICNKVIRANGLVKDISNCSG